ncbi:hypothetical protein BJV78DRAFT_1255238, partial [Lactifluus subvellereus]
NVFALRFREHCAVKCKFAGKWSRLNLVLHPTVTQCTCNEDTKKSADLRDMLPLTTPRIESPLSATPLGLQQLAVLYDVCNSLIFGLASPAFLRDVYLTLPCVKQGFLSAIVLLPDGAAPRRRTRCSCGRCCDLQPRSHSPCTHSASSAPLPMRGWRGTEGVVLVEAEVDREEEEEAPVGTGKDSTHGAFPTSQLLHLAFVQADDSDDDWDSTKIVAGFFFFFFWNLHL